MNPNAPQEPVVGFFVVAFISVQVLTVLGYWLTSKIVARDKGTLGNAVHSWLMLMGMALVIALLAVSIIATTGPKGNQHIIVGVFVVGLLLSNFLIPMRVYNLGCGGTILFFILNVVIGTILQGGAGIAIQRWMPGVADEALTQKFWNHFDAKLSESSKPTPVPPKSESLQARRDNLVRRGQELAIRKQYGLKDDPAAVAKYERDKAAYDSDLAKLKADEGVAK